MASNQVNRGSVDILPPRKTAIKKTFSSGITASRSLESGWKATFGTNLVSGLVVNEGSTGTVTIQESIDGDEVDREQTVSIADTEGTDGDTFEVSTFGRYVNVTFDTDSDTTKTRVWIFQTTRIPPTP